MYWSLTSALLLSTGAPTFALPLQNTTRYSGGYELENPFVPEPRGRGTVGLLWSCIVTFVLCIWTGVHPNILPHASSWDRFRYKIGWMMCAALLPEFTLLCAFGQWYKAKEIRDFWNKKYKNDLHPLGLEGGFFVLMGGLALKGEDGYVVTLTPEGFKECLMLDLVDREQIDKRLINDKGKASHLAKVLAVFQASWFIFQCISRKVDGLPVTLLEIHVAIQVVHTWISYFFWWCKPLDVNEPIIIKLSRDHTNTDSTTTNGLTTIETSPDYRSRTDSTATSEVFTIGPSPDRSLKPGSTPTRGPGRYLIDEIATCPTLCRLAGKEVELPSPEGFKESRSEFVPEPSKNQLLLKIAKLSESWVGPPAVSPAPTTFGEKETGLVTTTSISTEDSTRLEESSIPLKYNYITEKPRSGTLNLFLKCIYDVLEYIVGESYGDMRVVGLLFMSNGGLHLCAWGVHFPTTAEQTIWRVSCALISLGALIYIPVVALTPFEDYLLNAVWELRFLDKKTFRSTVKKFKEDYDLIKKHYPGTKGSVLRGVFVFSWLMTLTYTFCIFFITVESFISLRSLLKGAYSTPQWDGDKYFPHLG